MHVNPAGPPGVSLDPVSRPIAPPQTVLPGTGGAADLVEARLAQLAAAESALATIALLPIGDGPAARLWAGDSSSVAGPISVDHSVRHALPTESPLFGNGAEATLDRQLASARIDSEQKLTIAAHGLATASAGMSRPAQSEAQQVLSVASQLLDTGQYGYVVLAGKLGQAVSDSLSSPTHGASDCGAFVNAFVNHRLAEALSQITSLGLRFSWRLFLLLWLITGLLSGLISLVLRLVAFEAFSAALPIEIWGAGSLGLLGFGTYRRVHSGR